MTLASLKYVLFLAVTASVGYALPGRLRSRFLLAASYVFYWLAAPSFCLLLFAASLVSWACAAAAAWGLLGRRRLWTVLGALYLFGALFLYKYLNFFVNTALLLLGREPGFSSGLLLPVGISFYSFTAASYLFDVSRGRVEPERDFFRYALFVAFFPALLSGPINRAGALLPQLGSPRPFRAADVKAGLLRFTLGAVKKLVVADALGLFVNAAYAGIDSAPGFVLLLAIPGYALQLYFDFAGYTDMALGSAQILGFSLPENFRAPFLAPSLRKLWRRWHISLTSWLRDYLYFPLGGSRVPRGRAMLNLLIVFTVSGLWHGADLSFVLWGLVNGLLLAAESLLTPLEKRLRLERRGFLPLRVLWTFLLFSLSFVLFRADSTGQALRLLGRALSAPLQGAGLAALGPYTSYRRLGLALLGVLLFALADARELRTGAPALAGLAARRVGYWLFLALAVLILAIFGCYGGFGAQNFVYFQF